MIIIPDAEVRDSGLLAIALVAFVNPKIQYSCTLSGLSAVLPY